MVILVKKVISTIVNAIVKFIKKFFWVILVVVLIIYAPAIAAWLSTSGAPAWLTTAFQWVGSDITPYITGLWGGIKSAAGKLWTSFASAELSTQASILFGAAGLIAPEETAEVLGEAAKLAGELVTSVVGGVADGLGVPTLLLWAGGAVGLYAGYRIYKNRTESQKRQEEAEILRLQRS